MRGASAKTHEKGNERENRGPQNHARRREKGRSLGHPQTARLINLMAREGEKENESANIVVPENVFTIHPELGLTCSITFAG